MSKVSTGTVRWFDPRKGFGFIERDDDHIEVFVHFNGIVGGGSGRKNLTAGERVKFEVDLDAKAPQAIRVTRAP